MNIETARTLPARLWLFAGLLLLPFMLTNDSLWLDEGGTAMYALQPDFHSWWHRLRMESGSDCQMPLAMFFAWIFGQVLGGDEWQLRFVNVLWGALALIGMYRVGRRLQLPWLPLLLAIQPFFWFYQNEARPYALQLACGAWLLLALVEFICVRGAGETWAWPLAGSVFVLCLTTMLAPVTVAAVVLAGVVIAWWHRWKPSRKALLILSAGTAANLPIAVYYLITLLRGAKGAQLWHVDLKSFGYVFYELTGLTGLGLPIDEIRGLARSTHFASALAAHWSSFALPILGFALLMLVVFVGFRRSPGLPPGMKFGLIFSLGLTALLFVAGSLALQKAFWARHFAPVFPFYVTLLALALAGAAKSRHIFIRPQPYFLAGLLLFSALNLRFASAWRKEDYRAAAQFARQSLAENKTVWWLAAHDCGRYYHLQPAVASPEPGRIFSPQAGFSSMTGLSLPDVIIYSRPDINDPALSVQKLIMQNHYEKAAVLKSFIIWTKP